MQEKLFAIPLPGSGKHSNFDKLRACSKNMDNSHRFSFQKEYDAQNYYTQIAFETCYTINHTALVPSRPI